MYYVAIYVYYYLLDIFYFFFLSGNTTRRFVGHTKDVLSVAFSADNRQIVSGSRDKTIKLWNTLGVCKYTIQVINSNASYWVISTLLLSTLFKIILDKCCVYLYIYIMVMSTHNMLWLSRVSNKTNLNEVINNNTHSTIYV